MTRKIMIGALIMTVFCIMYECSKEHPEPTIIEPVKEEQEIVHKVEKEKAKRPTVMLSNEPVEAVQSVAEQAKPEKPTYKSIGIFKVTAYCSCRKCCGVWADMRPLDKDGNQIVLGSSGEVLIPEYSVATDISVIPYGTKIYIDGREYISHDTGGSIKGNSIDIYFDDHQKALEWGVQELEVFIKKGED